MATRSLFSNLRRFYTPNHLSIDRRIGVPRSLSSTVLESDAIEDSIKDDDLKSRIFRLRLPKRSATTALQNWVAEGNRVTISELRNIGKELRKRQRYKHALEISEWMVSHEEFELLESDYAVRIDLMTRVFGIDAAERYFQGLPPMSRGSEVFTALLHSYAAAKLIERAENLFERIKESNVTFNALTYNEMMTLYISVGQLEKVPSVIEDLKRRNVSPDLFTYNLWISACAGVLDIDSVRKILEEMKHDSNSKDGWVTYRHLADIYITLGNLANPAHNSLVEADKKITQRELITYDFLIILFTGLGNKERIDQAWKSLKLSLQKLTSRSYICILSSYLILGKVNEAGEILDEWIKLSNSDFDARTCHRLLNAFGVVGLKEKAGLLQTLMSQRNFSSAELVATED
ncbi:hypothetical protein Scep_001430 [Stephania cephalantha]|uniref:Pentatricopeptide repeat-containing protein n=1 Tax=Stephania cephalantha TaxID=152367 RepID=A0AAP0Q517_9MAGN